MQTRAPGMKQWPAGVFSWPQPVTSTAQHSTSTSPGADRFSSRRNDEESPPAPSLPLFYIGLVFDYLLASAPWYRLSRLSPRESSRRPSRACECAMDLAAPVLQCSVAVEYRYCMYTMCILFTLLSCCDQCSQVLCSHSSLLFVLLYLNNVSLFLFATFGCMYYKP